APSPRASSPTWTAPSSSSAAGPSSPGSSPTASSPAAPRPTPPRLSGSATARRCAGHALLPKIEAQREDRPRARTRTGRVLVRPLASLIRPDAPDDALADARRAILESGLIVAVRDSAGRYVQTSPVFGDLLGTAQYAR